jgi:hypothetical protein
LYRLGPEEIQALSGRPSRSATSAGVEAVADEFGLVIENPLQFRPGERPTLRRERHSLQPLNHGDMH